MKYSCFTLFPTFLLAFFLYDQIAKALPRDHIVLVGLSGRGEKDIGVMQKTMVNAFK